MSDELDLKKLLAEFVEGDDEHDDLEVVQESDWTSEGKYEYSDTVYRHIPTGRFVCIGQSRSGSYFSDYEYDDPSISEVVPEVVTITRYVAAPKVSGTSSLPAPAPSSHTPQ